VHGSQTKLGGNDIVLSDKAKSSLTRITEIKSDISHIIDNFPCYRIEDKEVSFALHYRKCPEKSLGVLKEINNILKKYDRDDAIGILNMKKVIEIKPGGVSKGDAVEIVNMKYGKDVHRYLNICIGDDLTDEDLFRANRSGVNIKVERKKPGRSLAGYYLKGVSEVYWFISKLSCWYGENHKARSSSFGPE
jgi:trehalose-phosphatase